MVMEETGSLASLLGRHTGQSVRTQPAVAVTVNWLKPSETKDSPSQTDEAEEILARILDPTKLKSTALFSKACREFLDGGRETGKDPTAKMAAGSLILASVVARCASESKQKKQFWPKKSLLRVISECNVAASSCLPFVLLAIQMEDVDVITCCLDHMQDIPDSMLAKCLQLYIRHFQGALNGSMDSAEDETSSASMTCPLTSHCAQCVNKALCCPFNDTFIIDSLRQINFDEALILLRYLHYLLSTIPASTSKINSASDTQNESIPSTQKESVHSTQDASVPTPNVVADWISAVLDAHYTQLLLSHEARNLIEQLAQAVQTQELFYTELEAVKAILQSFKDSVSVPIKQKSGSYSIEVLCL